MTTATRLQIRIACCGLVCAALWGGNRIELNDHEYFEAPGFSFLMFHNN